MNTNIENDVLGHPKFWALHKKYWTKEFNLQDQKTSNRIMNNPDCIEAKKLNDKVIRKVQSDILTEV